MMSDPQVAAIRQVIAEMRADLRVLHRVADRLEAMLGEAPAFDEEGIRYDPINGIWEALSCTLTKWNTRDAARQWMQSQAKRPPTEAVKGEG